MLKLATLCYVRRPGQTLMLHRIKKAGDMHAGKWNGLGGKLEPGETPEACAIREIYEESGLRVQAPELRGILTFPAFRPGEDWYAFVFVARHFSGDLRPAHEVAEGVLAWIDDDRLLELPLWEGDRIFLPWLEQSAFFSGEFIYQDGVLVRHAVHFYPVQAQPAAVPERGTVPAVAGGFVPVYQPSDDAHCWVCGGDVRHQQCKIICAVCGFTRDCSDP